MKPRKIAETFKSVPTIEGAGVHLKRGFGYHQVPLFDPFLMLDDFHTSRPDEYLAGFPWHPHRGIETITYIIEGIVEHGDSMGNKGVIGAGDVQWMTAGSGIIHQEMPKTSPTGTMWGFQLWANLPASQKMMAPRYRDVPAATIPQVTLASGTTVRLVSGRLEGVEGPVKDIVIEPELMDVSVPAGVVFEHIIKDGHTVVLYLLSGSAAFDGGSEDFIPETVILFERTGDLVRVNAGKSGVRFLLFSGRPLGEPVAWQGPIVMNSKEELRVAFEEYNNGTFIK
ncbi:MAG: pirin family protein [Geobacteraceae bacterium]|nr:pirin family protein [Geobacteraceae bacterium]